MIDEQDPLHGDSEPGLFWTTTNAGEAVPGVQTPLGLSAWRTAGSRGFEAAGRAIGVFAPDESAPAPAVNAFFGHAVMSVDFLRVIGERMPGADGPQVVSGLVGHVPDGMEFTSTRRYHLSVARRFPVTFRRVPAQLERLAAAQDAWWRTAAFADGLDEAGARAALRTALARHEEATVMQCVAVFTGVQPVHDTLERVITKLGVDGSSVLTAPVGGAEMTVVTDLWRASRGELDVADVVRAHGFHGPFEGELSSRVWREDDGPVRALIERYAARPDDESPLAQEARRTAARSRAERELVAAAPLPARPAVRALLALARRRLRLRGVAKRSMLQGFDGIRAASRMLGEILAADGRLADAGDVFYLIPAELLGELPSDAKDRVRVRRERREEYRGLELPPISLGVPTPLPVTGAAEQPPERNEVTGVGVSAGIVEAVARVVVDPAFVDVEDGEVLVASFTDPSWSSIMFVSAALVVDIGGALSHAAVVARELGIPCVVNTKDGTSVIRTGDRVRVDGRAGTVRIVQRGS